MRFDHFASSNTKFASLWQMWKAFAPAELLYQQWNSCTTNAIFLPIYQKLLHARPMEVLVGGCSACALSEMFAQAH
jgi:hypothetical protein